MSPLSKRLVATFAMLSTACVVSACDAPKPAEQPAEQIDAEPEPEPAADPCASVTCEAKPATCDGSDAVSFAGGVCKDGECVYDEARVACAELGLACDSGACADAASVGQVVSAGSTHSCRIAGDNKLTCWGDNKFGQLGNGEGGSIGTSPKARKPVKVTVAPSAKYTSVSSGDEGTCALNADGGVACWGDTFMVTRSKPMHTKWGEVSGVHVGSRHACVVLTGGKVQCVGANNYGALGNDEVDLDMFFAGSPVDALGLKDVLTMDTFVDHNCAVLRGGKVSCWGRNENGQIGDGTKKSAARPVEVTGLEGVIDVEVGTNHSCALLGSGRVKCWGDGALGQLGQGALESSLAPVEVAGLEGVVQLSAGSYHTCARTSAGDVSCWGLNRQGQLGQEDTKTNLAKPTRVTVEGVTWVAAGGTHTCAQTAAGVSCWGNNEFGALGDGGKKSSSKPVMIVK